MGRGTGEPTPARSRTRTERRAKPPEDCYLEPGTPTELASWITERWAAVTARYADDPLNCTRASRAWQREMTDARIDHEHICGQFLHPNGPWYHEFLLIGDDQRVFDPTAGQWPVAAEPDRYIIEPGDTDDEIGWSVADWREENRI